MSSQTTSEVSVDNEFNIGASSASTVPTTMTIQDQTGILLQFVISNHDSEERIAKAFSYLKYAWSTEDDVAKVRPLIEYALTQRKFKLWTIMVSSTCFSNMFFYAHPGDFHRACEVFGFDNIRSILEKEVFPRSYLRNMIDFVQLIPEFYVYQSEGITDMNKWCNEQLMARVKTMDHWEIQDLGAAISLVHFIGIRCFLDMRCEIIDTETLDFALGFVKHLHENRDEISSLPNEPVSEHNSVSQPEGSEVSRTIIDNLIHRWTTATQGFLVKRLRRREHWCEDAEDEESPMVVRKIIRSCLNVGQYEICRNILNSVLETPGEEISNLFDLKIPVLRDLCKLLREFGFPPYADPFRHFLRAIVEQYSQLLGSKTHNPQIDWLLRRIEKQILCTCKDCQRLKAFMKQLYVPQRTFFVSRKGYRHFSAVQCSGLATIEPVHSLSGLCFRVTKSEEFGKQRWERRVKRFRDFLALIGEEEVIAKLMEEKYDNLKEVMKG